jgi:hypothetical protein
MWDEFRSIQHGSGELCHDRCTGLLLTEYMRYIGAVRLDVKLRCTSLVLKCGVW